MRNQHESVRVNSYIIIAILIVLLAVPITYFLLTKKTTSDVAEKANRDAALALSITPSQKTASGVGYLFSGVASVQDEIQKDDLILNISKLFKEATELSGKKEISDEYKTKLAKLLDKEKNVKNLNVDDLKTLQKDLTDAINKTKKQIDLAVSEKETKELLAKAKQLVANKNISASDKTELTTLIAQAEKYLQDKETKADTLNVFNKTFQLAVTNISTNVEKQANVANELERTKSLLQIATSLQKTPNISDKDNESLAKLIQSIKLEIAKKDVTTEELLEFNAVTKAALDEINSNLPGGNSGSGKTSSQVN